MAIDAGTSTVTANKQDRGWRIEFFMDEDSDVKIRMHRELRAKDATTGEILSQDRASIPTVQRSSIQIATKSYSAGGLTATGQQIMQLLNKMSDTERQYDIDNPSTLQPAGAA